MIQIDVQILCLKIQLLFGFEHIVEQIDQEFFFVNVQSRGADLFYEFFL